MEQKKIDQERIKRQKLKIKESLANSKRIGWGRTYGHWLYNPVSQHPEWDYTNSLMESMFVSDQREISSEEENFIKTLSMLELIVCCKIKIPKVAKQNSIVLQLEIP